MDEERKQLEANAASAKAALECAEAALQEFERRPDNWRFENAEQAGRLEDVLLDRAHEDCEGSHNRGDDEYRQECYIGDKLHIAILTVEYNRHDKTYYYVDGHDFRIAEVA